MSDHMVTVRWTVRCGECGHEHVEKINHYTVVEDAPPPVPRWCDNCDLDLRGDRFAYVQEFKIEDVLELPEVEGAPK